MAVLICPHVEAAYSNMTSKQESAATNTEKAACVKVPSVSLSFTLIERTRDSTTHPSEGRLILKEIWKVDCVLVLILCVTQEVKKETSRKWTIG